MLAALGRLAAGHRRAPTPHRTPRARILVAALAVLLATGGAQAAFEWRDVRQEVRIEADGGIVVRDTRTLWTDDDFGEAFVCVRHGPDVTLTLLPETGAVDPGPRVRGFTQPCASGANGTEVVVAHPDGVRVDTRRVRFHYRLDGALRVHDDVVHAYREIYDRDNDPIALGYHLTVTAPGPATPPYRLDVHRFTTTEAPTVDRSADGARLDVRLDRIPRGERVVLQALLDPARFDPSAVRASDGTRRLDAYRTDARHRSNLGAPDAPTLDVGDADTTSAAVVRGRTDPRGAPVASVVAYTEHGDRVACDGVASFDCDLGPVALGTTRVRVIAAAANGASTAEDVVVTRRTPWDAARRHPAAAGPVLLALAWLIQGVARAFRRVGREPRSTETAPRYTPPREAPPGEVAAMRTQSRQGLATDAIFAATLVDLARRGWVTFEGRDDAFVVVLPPRTPATASADGSARDGSTQDGSAQDGSAQHGPTPDGPTPAYERELLAYLSDAAEADGGDGRRVDREGLQRHASGHPAFSEAWAKRVRDAVEARYGGPLTTDVSRAAARGWAIAAGLTALTGVAYALVVAAGVAAAASVVAAVVAGAIVPVALVALPAWRPDVGREVAAWTAFRRTLRTPELLRDAPDALFERWDHTLAYAIALGVGQPFAKALARVSPDRDLDPTELAARATWMGSDVQGARDVASVAASAAAMSATLSSVGATATSGGAAAGGGGAGGR